LITMKIKNSKGFTLIELMIGLAAGIIVMAGILTAVLALSRSNRENLDAARLYHELNATVAIIENDLRRAGYWGAASTNLNVGANNNPFMATGTNISIINNDCVIFTYDRNGDGVLAAINDANGDERYGYRLKNQTVQKRPNSLATFSCADADNTWFGVSGTNTNQITNLTITPANATMDLDGAGPGTATVTVRNITITLSGQLANDNTVTRTLIKTVRVRNDLYTP